MYQGILVHQFRKSKGRLQGPLEHLKVKGRSGKDQILRKMYQSKNKRVFYDRIVLDSYHYKDQDRGP